MSLVACHECRSPVSTVARACPTCGARPARSAPTPGRARLNRVLLTLLGLLMMYLVVVGVVLGYHALAG